MFHRCEGRDFFPCLEKCKNIFSVRLNALGHLKQASVPSSHLLEATGSQFIKQFTEYFCILQSCKTKVFMARFLPKGDKQHLERSGN